MEKPKKPQSKKEQGEATKREKKSSTKPKAPKPQASAALKDQDTVDSATTKTSSVKAENAPKKNKKIKGVAKPLEELFPANQLEELHELSLDSDNITHSGFVAIVGRPNVGKSTLLNSILGEKLSITSPKPQTTRHRIVGVKTSNDVQTIYVDTPGLHLGEKRAINKYMNQTARRALKDVDVVVFVVEGLQWTDEDEMVLKLLANVHCPVLLAVNKVDEISEKAKLLPHIKQLAEKFAFAEIVPLSAKSGDNVGALEKKIAKLLPEGPLYYPEGQITDRPIRFRLAEIIREKLMFELDQEVPYGIAVEIEMLKEEEKVTLVYAIIWVEKSGHKPIVIGKHGAVLKKVGIEARRDMENLLHRSVHLKLWVKVKGGWSDDARALKSLGYVDLP